MAPGELAAWLQDRVPRLHELWTEEIRIRAVGQHHDVARIMGRFVDQLTHMLPHLLGPLRGQVRPLWDRACELFGVVAAKRGLAAGEVIEEFHVLRELVIRELYKYPPHGGRRPLSLPETLRLNRALDRAVTHASVGHTDAMFYDLLERDGAAPAPTNGSMTHEAEAQLALIGEELERILALHARRGNGGLGG
jgi:hypothetical protein